MARKTNLYVCLLGGVCGVRLNFFVPMLIKQINKFLTCMLTICYEPACVKLLTVFLWCLHGVLY